ncbi:NPCBM/NEW2 domain-containing protein [bacterium]|nr:NPCBM/NEW2 domain-containing protein [bacterium]
MLLISLPVWSAPEAAYVPLVALRYHYFTNCMTQNEQFTMTKGMEVDHSILGLGGEAAATIQYELKEKYDYFESLVGYADSAPSGRTCTFELWADGTLISKVGPISSDDAPDILRGNIKKAKMITLRMVPGKYNATSGAMWGNPKVFTGVDPSKLNDSLIVHINGNLIQTTPIKLNGKKSVSIPFPIVPGQHVYSVETDYDETSGRVNIKYHDVNEPYTETQKSEKPRLPQPVTIRR